MSPLIADGFGPADGSPFLMITDGFGPFVLEEAEEVDQGWTPIQSQDATWVRVSP